MKSPFVCVWDRDESEDFVGISSSDTKLTTDTLPLSAAYLEGKISMLGEGISIWFSTFLLFPSFSDDKLDKCYDERDNPAD